MSPTRPCILLRSLFGPQPPASSRRSAGGPDVASHLKKLGNFNGVGAQAEYNAFQWGNVTLLGALGCMTLVIVTAGACLVTGYVAGQWAARSHRRSKGINKGVQAQCTYKRDRSQPRFQPVGTLDRAGSYL